MPRRRPVALLSVARFVRARRSSSIRRRVWLPPVVAGVALGIVFVLTVSLGLVNQRRLGRLERGLYPSLQASRAMLSALDRQKEHFEAAMLSDPDRLASADTAGRNFLRALRQARSARGAVQAHLDSIAAWSRSRRVESTWRSES